MSAVVETWDTWALSGKQDQTVTGIGTSKLYLTSGLGFPRSYSKTSGFPRLSDSHFMMFYYRAGLSQASHYSINTVGTGSKMFLQKSRGSSSDKDFAAEKWYCKWRQIWGRKV